MALQTIDVKSLPEGEAEALAAILTELQGLKVSVATGALNGAHDINVTGIATGDTLLAVLRLHKVTTTVVTASGSPDTTAAITYVTDVTDITSEASITSTGHIRCTTTDTTGDKLIVVWFNKDDA